MAIGSYTRAQVRSRLQAKLDSSPFWTDTEANNAINEAIRIYGLMTGLWKTRVSVTTTGDDGRIYFDSTVLRPFRISRSGTPLMQATLQDIDNAHPGWEMETTASGGGVPTQVAAWLSLHWSVDLGTPQAKIAIWPVYASGSATLVVDAYKDPPVMTLDADELELDDADLEAILARALIYLAFKKPRSLTMNMQNWQKEFSRAVTVRNGRLAASDQFKKIFGNPQDAQKPMRVGVED